MTKFRKRALAERVNPIKAYTRKWGDAHVLYELPLSNSFSKLKGEASLQTTSFSICSCKVSKEAEKECFISIHSTQPYSDWDFLSTRWLKEGVKIILLLRLWCKTETSRKPANQWSFVKKLQKIDLQSIFWRGEGKSSKYIPN